MTVVYVWTVVRVDMYGRPRTTEEKHGKEMDSARAQQACTRALTRMHGSRVGSVWKVGGGRAEWVWGTSDKVEAKHAAQAQQLCDDVAQIWITEAKKDIERQEERERNPDGPPAGDPSAADLFEQVKKETERVAFAAAQATGSLYSDEQVRRDEPTADVQLFEKLHGTFLVAPQAVNDAAKRRMDFIAAQKVTRGKSVKVAVLDTGCRRTHPSLTPLVCPVIDATGRGGGDRDTNGHGTFVVSQIVGDVPVEDPFGTAIEVEVYPVQVLDSSGGWGADSWIARGIDAAVALKVQVINMSLGGNSPMPLTHESIKRAVQAGVTVVVASGNGGRTLPDVAWPARYPESVAVGAVDDDGRESSFGQKGPGLDVYACGVAQYGATQGETYGRWSGTSMAAPHVAAAAAMVYGVYRELHGEWPTPRLVLESLASPSVVPADLQDIPFAAPGVIQVGESLKEIPVPGPTPPQPPAGEPYVLEWVDDRRGWSEMIGELAALTYTTADPLVQFRRVAAPPKPGKPSAHLPPVTLEQWKAAAMQRGAAGDPATQKEMPHVDEVYFDPATHELLTLTTDFLRANGSALLLPPARPEGSPVPLIADIRTHIPKDLIILLVELLKWLAGGTRVTLLADGYGERLKATAGDDGDNEQYCDPNRAGL